MSDNIWKLFEQLPGTALVTGGSDFARLVAGRACWQDYILRARCGGAHLQALPDSNNINAVVDRDAGTSRDERTGMSAFTVCRVIGAYFVASSFVMGALSWNPGRAIAVDTSPFEKLLGRWVGEGRLGVRDNATEHVKCRVTYVVPGSTDQLQQTIRCASGSGSIEVRSTVTHAAGALTGTWTELVRNMHGDVTGTVTPRGFKVNVQGEGLKANMDIVIMGTKQIIEIQFIDSSLIGLTLILTKG